MSKRLHCRYCKRGLIHPSRDIPARNQSVSATRDHIIPKSRGGTATDWCCWQCNQIKSNMTLIEWARFMQAHPEWWVRFRSHAQARRAIARAGFPFFVAKPPLCRGLAA